MEGTEGTLAQDIRFILECALHAPSGDNTQPWRWAVSGSSLQLWDDSPENTVLSIYNTGSSVYCAFGTAIENAIIAASSRGYRISTSYFPDPSRPRLVAILALSVDAGIPRDPLAPMLLERVTNRHPYRREPLTSDERDAIRRVPGGEGMIRLVEDRVAIDRIAKIASLHDELLFSMKDLHAQMFSLISWTKREDARRRIGFYFPTLAAPPFTWGFMQIIRHWWVMRIGISLGLHRLIAFEQQQVYRRAGAYGVVLVSADSPAAWIEAGRLIERTWLTVNQIGLDLHPMNGALLFAHSLTSEEGKKEFPPGEQVRLKNAREEIARLFGVEEKRIAFMFRIGHGAPASARTSRLPFKEKVTLDS